MPGQIFYHTLDGEPPHGGFPPRFNHFQPQACTAPAPAPANGPFFAAPPAAPPQIRMPASAPAPAPALFPFAWNQNIFHIPAAAPAPQPAVAEPPRVVFVPAPPAPPSPRPQPARVVFIRQPATAPSPPPLEPGPPVYINWGFPPIRLPITPPSSSPPPTPPVPPRAVINEPVAAPPHNAPFPEGTIIIHRASTPAECPNAGANGLPQGRFHFRAMALEPTATVAQLLDVLDYGADRRVFTMHEAGGGAWVEGLTLRRGDERTLMRLGWAGAGWTMQGESGGEAGAGRKAMWIVSESVR